ncbi:adenylate/guanylate cyclase domain-containing protein [Paenibacillus sp. J53TS2]|uniref:CHASE2 domain-containing protein n=1 Tax=unclassified Paenibacillus TaxID=185978 RepID=UPI001B276A4A|nr:adenylate/guanylate cyclase domain-containing protein [Paenibacillus sp. J53TS2]GIP49611.1 adenylate/guanylate cyclase domain-containing protein [Paenibacillus sp. J53TS2]
MRRRLFTVWGVLIGIALFLVYRGYPSSLDSWVEDRVYQRQGFADSRIVLIGIDDESIRSLGQWPWPRSVHAELLDRISSGHPAVVAFDLTFQVPSSSPGEDAAWVEAVSKAGNVVLPTYGTFPPFQKRGVVQALTLADPFDALREAAAAVGHINVMADQDQIVRRSLLRFEYKGRAVNHMAWEIYRLYATHVQDRNPSGGMRPLESPPVDEFGRFVVPFTGIPGQYEMFSYASVLRGDIPADYFADKIVMIGPYTASLQDNYVTPLDHHTPMYGVEIHANIVQALLENNDKKTVEWHWNALLLLVMGAAAYVFFRLVHPAYSLLMLAVLTALLLAGGRWLYDKGLLISIGYPLIFLGAFYLAALLLRYFYEWTERRRVTEIFGRYVAPQVVNQILSAGRDGLKLGGVRRTLTVMFVDIRGFTSLSESSEPEEIVSVVNEYLDLAARCIFRYEGTLDKFIGDAAMAIFNAPLEQEDHAFKAVQAALAIQKGAAELESKWKARLNREISFGIGIHTGPAVFGNIGSRKRMDYTAIGDTVNTAARLESRAKPGRILLSEAVYVQIEGRVAVSRSGFYQLKGKEQEIVAYEVEGLL